MIYFRKNNDIIEKYQINFDKKQIKELKEKIIYDCSFIKHVEYEGAYEPRFTDEIIRNYTSTPTGKEKDFDMETRDICQYKYDEYIPPYLIKLIDKLLNNNSTVINKILNYKENVNDDFDIDAKKYIDNKIISVNQEFNNIAPEDITKKKEKLKELEELLNAKVLNKNQQSIDLYYDQLINLIKFNLIDSLPISELNRIESFLEYDLSSDIEINNSKKIVKSLKK